MEKIKTNFQKYLIFKGINNILIIFLIVNLSLIAYQSTYFEIIENDIVVNPGDNQSWGQTNPWFLGGSNIVNVYEGQKINVKISFSDIVHISIVQAVPDSVNEIVYFRGISSSVDDKFSIKKLGDIQVIIQSIANKTLNGNIKITNEGVSTPALNVILILALLVVFNFAFSYYSKKQISYNAKDYALHRENTKNKFSNFMIFYEKNSMFYLTIAIVYPLFFLITENPPHYFDNNGKFSSLNSEDYSYEIFIYLVNVLSFNLILFFGFGVPILYYQKIHSEAKNYSMHEESYPSLKAYDVFSRNISLFNYIVIIPLLDFAIRLYYTYYFNTLGIDYLILLYSVMAGIIILYFLISVYLLVFVFLPYYSIRIVFPFLLLIISGILVSDNREKVPIFEYANLDDSSSDFGVFMVILFLSMLIIHYILLNELKIKIIFHNIKNRMSSSNRNNFLR